MSKFATSEPLAPALNWAYLITVAIVVSSALGFISFALTMQVFHEWLHRKAISGVWTWSSVVLMDIVLLGMLIGLFWKMYCDGKTQFGQEELSCPNVTGWKRIRWSDVTRIDRVGFGYHIYSQNQKIVVTPYAYKQPESVLRLIRTRLAKAKGYASPG